MNKEAPKYLTAAIIKVVQCQWNLRKVSKRKFDPITRPDHEARSLGLTEDVETREEGTRMRIALVAIAIIAQMTVGISQAAANTLRVAVLKFGTVNWELDVIKHHGLDKKAGIDLQVMPLASTQATKVALQSGAANIMVTDWMWVSRQRTDGADFTFVPYSSSVGAIMVPSGPTVEKLAALKGKKIGVAGGPIDKNWLLLVAVAEKREGFALDKGTEQVFGAPPLLAEKAAQGEIDAVLNYWHYCARLEARGFKRLLDVQDAAAELGAKGRVSMLGYVFRQEWADENQEAVKAFVQASKEAKEILKTSDEEWERIRSLTKAKDDQTLVALRDRYREGIPSRSPAEEEADAKTLFTVLEKLGGKKLVGAGKTLADGTFWNGQ